MGDQPCIVVDHDPRDAVPLMTLRTDSPERFDRAIEALKGAYFIAPEGSRPDLLPLVVDQIS